MHESWISWKTGYQTLNFTKIKFVESVLEALPLSIFTAYVFWAYEADKPIKSLAFSFILSVCSLGYTMATIPFLLENYPASSKSRIILKIIDMYGRLSLIGVSFITLSVFQIAMLILIELSSNFLIAFYVVSPYSESTILNSFLLSIACIPTYAITKPNPTAEKIFQLK